MSLREERPAEEMIFASMARILLIEDHEIIRRMLCDSLKDLGHRADCVQTKAEAEQALATRIYALVIQTSCCPMDRE
jgi:CheY-like chemotaxis protein